MFPPMSSFSSTIPSAVQVVIDLYHAATRYDEPPTYRLTGEGSVEVGKKPRKGGIVDLLA